MSENTSSRTDVACTDQRGGFEFIETVEDHEIEVDYSWRYVDRIQLAEGQTKRIDDPDGYFGGDEEYSCTVAQSSILRPTLRAIPTRWLLAARQSRQHLDHARSSGRTRPKQSAADRSKLFSRLGVRSDAFWTAQSI